MLSKDAVYRIPFLASMETTKLNFCISIDSMPQKSMEKFS